MRARTARRRPRRKRRTWSPDASTGAVIMKYFPLIWASLFRRRARTILTLLSVVTAFVLFGLLDAVRLSFSEAGQSANGAQRLQSSAKLSFIDTLPMSLGAQIAQVPGVTKVTFANWFGGAYKDPHNQV